jgi:coenzyme F420-0:L-glutamate ligase/coenzyme F420-1:gamma-L-glutamate ligase
VLPKGEHGPGASATIRPREQDLFSLGARDAVIAAVAADDQGAFGPPASIAEVRTALARCGFTAHTDGPDLAVDTPDPGATARCVVLAAAHNWTADGATPTSRLSRRVR